MVALGVIFFGATGWYFWRQLQKSQHERQIHRMLESLGVKYLHDIILPDGIEGYTYIDYLLLTPNGIAGRATGAVSLNGISDLTLDAHLDLEFNSGIAIDETIGNTTNSEIKFAENGGEDIIFDMDAGTNAVGLKSSSGVDELAMGAVDDLTGVGTIAFDAEDSTISLAA